MEVQTLKTCLQAFRKLDEELKQYNEKAAELRREKKEIEDKMSQILSMPEYSSLEKLENSEDGSILRISRPAEWKKGWSMSKKELQDGLNDYFWVIKKTTHEPGWEPNAEECFGLLVDKQEKKMIATEFAFDRTLAKPKKLKV
jgi:hypothetical protein